MDLFKDWLPSVTANKNYLFDGSVDIDELERGYPCYMMNRALSQYMDTAIQANEMNVSSNLDPKLQYDYLFHMVPKGKRYAKWAKAGKDETIKAIVKAYCVTPQKAEDMAALISDEGIEQLKAYLEEGGKK